MFGFVKARQSPELAKNRQTLRYELPGVVSPVARRPEGDKHSRMAGVSGQIAGGQQLLPPDAPWLESFNTDLLGFPNARFDNQADALTQLMGWALGFQDYTTINDVAGPILFTFHRDGTTEIMGDDGSKLARAGMSIPIWTLGGRAIWATNVSI